MNYIASSVGTQADSNSFTGNLTHKDLHRVLEKRKRCRMDMRGIGNRTVMKAVKGISKFGSHFNSHQLHCALLLTSSSNGMKLLKPL